MREGPRREPHPGAATRLDLRQCPPPQVNDALPFGMAHSSRGDTACRLEVVDAQQEVVVDDALVAVDTHLGEHGGLNPNQLRDMVSGDDQPGFSCSSRANASR